MSLKEAKFNFIVEVATKLFMQNSIGDVTIKDIAEQAGVGEATIYRYFSKKEAIVLACVMMIQNNISSNYFNLSEGKTGYEKIEIFYNSYLDIFKDSPDYFYFIKEFDAYMYTQHPSSLKTYEKEIDKYHQDFIEAYELGVRDGSITPVKNVDIFYFSTTHSLMELCKKLSINKALLTQDKTIKKAAEIQCLIKIILKSIKSN